jgi:outer membrane lipoprotein-sorting protein
MRSISTLAFTGLLALTLRAESLQEILSRMDRAAEKFHSYSANMKRLNYTALIDETEEMIGTARFKKAKGGMIGVVEFFGNDPKVIQFSGRNLEIYYPKAKTREIYNAGKHANTMDEILVMGFGTSGAELRKGYEVTLGGTETVAGVKTTRLELIPKNDEVRKLVSKIELWIPEGQSSPTQEKLTQPSKNYSLVSFTDVKINPALSDSEYTMKVPAGVKTLYPQK